MGVEIFRVLEGFWGLKEENAAWPSGLLSLFSSVLLQRASPKEETRRKWDFDINPIPRSIRARIGVSDQGVRIVGHARRLGFSGFLVADLSGPDP